VYKLDPTGNEKVQYSFKGTPDAATPQTGLIADSEGNLYGTTINGGTAGSGAVYKLDRAGQETVLYSFTGGTVFPSGLIRDSAGNLYGTTFYVGASNYGVVFKLDTAGQETVLPELCAELPSTAYGSRDLTV
jgi:uncharacterized repeat protein (TIGR03803 family)